MFRTKASTDSFYSLLEDGSREEARELLESLDFLDDSDTEAEIEECIQHEMCLGEICCCCFVVVFVEFSLSCSCIHHHLIYFLLLCLKKTKQDGENSTRAEDPIEDDSIPTPSPAVEEKKTSRWDWLWGSFPTRLFGYGKRPNDATNTVVPSTSSVTDDSVPHRVRLLSLIYRHIYILIYSLLVSLLLLFLCRLNIFRSICFLNFHVSL